MKFSSSKVLVAAISVIFSLVTPALAKPKSDGFEGGLRHRRANAAEHHKPFSKIDPEMIAEDSTFFLRLLQDESSMPPVFRPTSRPTKAPVAMPTTPAATQRPVVDPTPRPTKASTPQTTTAPVPDPTRPPTKAPVPMALPTEPAQTPPPVPDPTPSPTKAPVVDPTPSPTKFPVADPTPPTKAPLATPSPTEAPATCPVRIEIDCSMGGTQCRDIKAPASGTGAGCIVEVGYTYTIVNDASVPEQIYAVSVIRNGVTIVLTDIPDQIPTTIMAPGETLTIRPDMVEINLCGGNTFDTQVNLVTGPPIDVDIAITCVTDEGVNCAAIGVVPPDSSLPCDIDITYSYIITNTGAADTTFQVLSRTRNDEVLDLIPLLDDTSLAVGASTTVAETVGIDRCIAQDFTITTQVVQAPNPDILCQDTAFYIHTRNSRD